MRAQLEKQWVQFGLRGREQARKPSKESSAGSVIGVNKIGEFLSPMSIIRCSPGGGHLSAHHCFGTTEFLNL